MNKFLQSICCLVFLLVPVTNVFSEVGTKIRQLELAKDTSKVNLLYDIGWSYRNSIPDSLYYYGQQALELSKKLDYQSGIARSFSLVAVYYLYEANYDEALKNYNQALKIYMSTRDKSKEASVLSNVGNIYYRKSKYAEALRFYNKALEIRQGLKNKTAISSSYTQIGVIHTELGNFDKALDFLYQAMEIKQTLKDTFGLAICHNNIAVNYFEQENYEKSVEQYKAALKLYHLVNNKRGIAETANNLGEAYLKLNDPEQAMEQFDMAIELFEEMGHKKGIVSIFSNMAWVNFYEGEFYKARRNCLHALRENIAIEDREGETDVLLLLGKIEMEDQKPENAIEYLLEAIRVAEEIASKKYIRDIAFELFNAYSQAEDYKNANTFLFLYSNTKDSLLNKEKMRTIERLSANFDIEQQKHELSYKNQEISLLQEAAQLESQRSYALAASIVLLMIIALLVILRMRYQRKKEKELAVKDKELAESQNELVKAALKNTRLESGELKTRLDFKNKEIQNFALHIVEKNELMQEIVKEINELKKSIGDKTASDKIKDLSSKINYSLSLDKERKEFQNHVEMLNEEFFLRLTQKFPDISDSEKRLSALLRMGLSSKEISTILNISPKSVDMSRYRLRKKFEIEKEDSLTEFISNI